MLKLIGWFVKTVVFALVVIVAGNLVSWDGMSVNERVMKQVGRLTRLGQTQTKVTQKWAGGLAHDAQAGYQKKLNQSQVELEKISSSERQKLRALIEELNTSSAAPARH